MLNLKQQIESLIDMGGGQSETRPVASAARLAALENQVASLNPDSFITPVNTSTIVQQTEVTEDLVKSSSDGILVPVELDPSLAAGDVLVTVSEDYIFNSLTTAQLARLTWSVRDSTYRLTTLTGYEIYTSPILSELTGLCLGDQITKTLWKSKLFVASLWTLV